MKIKLFLSLAAALLLGAVSLRAQEAKDLDPQYAKDLIKSGQAPDFTLPGTDGKTYSLKDFRGKTLIIDFWATWCPDCRADVPALKEIVKKYGSKKIRFISISSDTDKEKWVSYVKENKMKWTHVSELVPRKESKVSADYRVRWIPSVYVIDPEGKILLGTVVLPKVEALLSTL